MPHEAVSMSWCREEKEHRLPYLWLTEERTMSSLECNRLGGPKGEECDREATLIVIPNVGDGTTGEGEGCGGEEATEETADKECLYVRGDGARDVENDVEETGDDPDGSAAIQLTLRTRSAKVP